MVADNELRQFRAQGALRTQVANDTQRPGRVLRQGVWAYVRHPNYVGELGFWLALGLAGYAASGQIMSLLGFVCMLALFLGVSIPMIERRQLEAKPDYAAYQADVGALIPKLVKKVSGRED